MLSPSKPGNCILQSAKGKSLLDIIDKTSTPMGGKVTSQKINPSIKNINEINRRLSLVEFLNKEDQLKYEISLRLRTISDLDRLMGKLAAEKISPKELGYLRQSLESIQEIKNY